MIFEIFNLFFGLITIILSLRYELGMLNYTLGLNYSALMLYGIEIIRVNINVLIGYQSLDLTNYMILVLLLLAIYNNLTIFTFEKVYLIFIFRFTIVVLIITSIILDIMDNLNSMIIILAAVNAMTMLVTRLVHFDEFKYGTIHQRYAYGAALLYMCVFIELIVKFLGYKKEIHLYYLLLSIAFVYDFQLNLYYKAIRWGYSTFIRSGTISRLLFIVDYYEIPDTKI
jgi:hypothetical protein